MTGETFRLVRCARCDFARTAPIPRRLERYYPTAYRAYTGVFARVLRALYLRRVDSWHLAGRGRALEVGAGRGWMVRALRERGWDAVGTERTVEAARAASAEGGVPVFVGDVSALAERPLLDLVLMFHVLEHIADPLAILDSVAGRLRPGGMLILGLPNLASWQASLTRRHWHHLDVPRHLCHFSPRSIERALTAVGLRTTRIDVRSPEHDPLGWMFSVLDALGFEQGLLLKLLAREPRRSGPAATVAALLVAVPLAGLAMLITPISWAAGRGAVMEVWAVRDQR